MQPKSIQRFDICYLGSIGLFVVSFFLGYDATLAEMQAQMEAAAQAQGGGGFQIGGGFLTGVFIVSLSISLLLWYLVSNKANVVAMWILVIFFLLGLLGIPGALRQLPSIASILGLASIVLQAAAVFFLFKPDSKAWFAKDE